MKDVLIYTAVSGRYVNYIPMWKLFIEASYPEYDVYVCVLDDGVCRKKQKYYAACARFVIDPFEYFPYKYEFIYITDVDVMILRENPTLLNIHLNRMVDSFSNVSRDASEVNECGRLTGLHFVHQNWYKKTSVMRSFYLQELNTGVTGNKPWDDEVILYKIAAMSGLKIPKIEDPFQFHHGIHLGNQRNIEKYSEDKKRKYMLSHITKEWAEGWNEVSKSKEYIIEKEVLHGKDKQAYSEIVTVEKYVEMILKGVKV